ncbi:MAG: D-alanine--D-alanine ligase [Bacteroidota bacterium]|nr:D-alanine--D-alanine ligase [Bacteroidota bacterium]MDP4289676.1 D-alanine--D-alanine ligase [Bacteroidota bacterium]
MKKKIALVMGGDSGEYEVSIQSAETIQKSIDQNLYEVYPILIRGKNWTHSTDSGLVFHVNKNDFSLQFPEKKIVFDAVFIAIHGTPGEDGKLQGYFEMMGIPYTSCNLTVSAITFNKYFCNDLALQYGMNVPATVLLRKADPVNPEAILSATGLPCFVKPNKAGSSCGVTKVKAAADLEQALAVAFKEDDEVLVQQFIKGRELACGVFRYKGEIIVLPATEIISKNEFFDYEAKYKTGMASEITPAPLTPEQTSECQKQTAYLYDKFNCKGVVRFDYFLTGDKFWFLEVNTVPGLTANSLVPKQAAAKGIAIDKLFSMLLEETLTA